MSENSDLFDAPIPTRRDRAKGYGGRIGAGPKGETCGTCIHAVLSRADWGAPVRLVCGLVRHTTVGPAAAVKRSAAACQHWEGQL